MGISLQRMPVLILESDSFRIAAARLSAAISPFCSPYSVASMTIASATSLELVPYRRMLTSFSLAKKCVVAPRMSSEANAALLRALVTTRLECGR